MHHFEELNLLAPLLAAVRAEGYSTPTPIQAQAIPHVLVGKDLLGCAQTGTGKTAAFALPILHRLATGAAPEGAHPVPPAIAGQARPTRVLVLTPTRELATQIGESFATYGKNLRLNHTVIFGGVGQDPQVRALKSGIDVLVATPGRLLDLMGQGFVNLKSVQVFVLDEADRMLDMGFLHDVRRVIAALPKERQTLLFSATMPVDIQELARSILRDPVRVEVTPVATTAEKIDQSVYFVEKNDKRILLEDLLQDGAIRRVLVFTRTKHGANKVVEQLERSKIPAEAIHGNKSQNARTRALANFKSGETRVLVATDIAARGIDIEGITHVINYDLPNIPESYVHRIGRTARAGASGIAISFCAADEREFLRDIERLIRMKVRVVTGHATESHAPEQPPAPQGRGSESRGPKQNQKPGGSRGPRANNPGGQSRGHHGAGRDEGGQQPRAAQAPAAGGGAPANRGRRNRGGRAPHVPAGQTGANARGGHGQGGHGGHGGHGGQGGQGGQGGGQGGQNQRQQHRDRAPAPPPAQSAPRPSPRQVDEPRKPGQAPAGWQKISRR